MEIYIRYRPMLDDDLLVEVCPDFEPFREPGIGTDIVIVSDGVTTEEQTEQSPAAALACFSKLYQFQLADSIFLAPEMLFYEHPKTDDRGLLLVFDLAYLPRGAYQLEVLKLTETEVEDRDTLQFETYKEIPFWME